MRSSKPAMYARDCTDLNRDTTRTRNPDSARTIFSTRSSRIKRTRDWYSDGMGRKEAMTICN